MFVGSGDQHLYSVDASTGRMRWKLPTDGAIRSSPTGGSGLVYVGSGDFRLYAVDATTGTKRWSFETYGPVDDSSPVLVGDTVYFGQPGPSRLCTRRSERRRGEPASEPGVTQRRPSSFHPVAHPERATGRSGQRTL